MIGLSTIGLGLAASIGQAAEPAMPPSGKWTIDYGADCTLSRAFKGPDGEITLGIRPNIMSPGGEIVLVAPANGRGRYETGKGRMTLRSEGPAFAMRYARVPVAGKPYQGVTVEPDATMWDAVAEAREVAIDAGDGPALRFATGALDKPLAALKTCQEAQLRFWGGDPAAMAKLPPGPKLATWFGPADYPEAAIRRGARGRSVALIKVDRAGKAVECRTVRSAGDAALDTAVCAGAKRRGRFDTAENGPEVRWATLSVRWWTP